MLALAKKILKGRFQEIPGHYSKELQSVIESMLKCDPDQRPTIDELLSLP